MKRIVAVLLSIFMGMTMFTMAPAQAEDVCEIVIETVTFDVDNPGTTLIEEAVNAITVPEIGVKIKLKNMSIRQHEMTIGHMINDKEALDLVMVGLSYPIMNMVADGLLMPIEELVTEHGPKLYDIFGDMMKAGYIGDTLYAIPAKTSTIMASGLLYNGEMAFQAGVEVPEKCSLEELGEIFAAVKENVPEAYGTAFVSGVSMPGFLMNMETYGGRSNEFGVTFNQWENTEIVNLYESEQYLEYCKIMRQWNKKGYFPPNVMTSSVVPSERFKKEQIFCLFTGFSPLTAANEMVTASSKLVQITEAVDSTGLIQERMWGVPVSSKNPGKAIEFLQFLFERTDVANIFMYGIEGVHYTKLNDTIITHTDNQDYKRVFSIFGDQHKEYQWYPSEETVLEEQLEFEADAKVSKTLGYIFDNTPVLRETEAVEAVISMYAPAIEFGMMEDVEGAIAVFVQELKKAGIDRIIEENRRQLEAWMMEQE